MKIAPINFNFRYNNQNKPQKETQKFQYNNHTNPLYQGYFYLPFLAKPRVDKDLSSWRARNEESMPLTTKNYIENLPEDKKSSFTPLEIRQRAFEYLNICETPDDIKMMFPDEPLFKDLKSANDPTKAAKGILYDLKTIKPVLDECDEQVIENCSDLTVYLVKKVFLEAKTPDEINNDLDNDLNPVFKRKDKHYIAPSTLRTLGIHIPKDQTSLRYTIDGYSDRMGSLISLSYELLPEDKKEEMIVKRQETISNRTEEDIEKLSKKLSNAQKEYWQSLEKEEYEKRIGQLQSGRKKYWENLSPEEKTKYIERLQTGKAKQKIIMINAWNNCPEVRLGLSKALCGADYSDVDDIIYTSKMYSGALSRLMTLFWENNPDFAEKMGNEISKSYAQYTQAESNNQLDEYINNVLSNQAKAKDEIRKQIKEELKTQTPKQRHITTYSPNEAKESDNIEVKKINLISDYVKNSWYLPKDFLEDTLRELSKLNIEDVELFIGATTSDEDYFSIPKNEEAKKLRKIYTDKFSEEYQLKFVAISTAIEFELQDCIKRDEHGFKPLLSFQNTFEPFGMLHQIMQQGKTYKFRPNLFTLKTYSIIKTFDLEDSKILESLKLDKDYNYELGSKPDKKVIKRSYQGILYDLSDSERKVAERNVTKYIKDAPKEKLPEIRRALIDNLTGYSILFTRDNYLDYVNLCRGAMEYLNRSNETMGMAYELRNDFISNFVEQLISRFESGNITNPKTRHSNFPFIRQY